MFDGARALLIFGFAALGILAIAAAYIINILIDTFIDERKKRRKNENTISR